MVIEKVSVSVARVSSLTWIVNVYVPSVLGVPKISPVLDAKSNSFVPSGSRPSTTLNVPQVRIPVRPLLGVDGSVPGSVITSST